MSISQRVMSPAEAQCFKRLRQWQRVYLCQRLQAAFVPSLPWQQTLCKTHLGGKLLLILFTVVASPVLILLWCLRILRALLVYPFIFIASFFKPFTLKSPGERTIRGMYYQFNIYAQLPPHLHVRCIDDWVSILYGADKLEKYALSTYLGSITSQLNSKELKHNQSMREIVQVQISQAREQLSQDLGNYFVK